MLLFMYIIFNIARKILRFAYRTSLYWFVRMYMWTLMDTHTQRKRDLLILNRHMWPKKPDKLNNKRPSLLISRLPLPLCAPWGNQTPPCTLAPPFSLPCNWLIDPFSAALLVCCTSASLSLFPSLSIFDQSLFDY